MTPNIGETPRRVKVTRLHFWIASDFAGGTPTTQFVIEGTIIDGAWAGQEFRILTDTLHKSEYADLRMELVKLCRAVRPDLEVEI